MFTGLYTSAAGMLAQMKNLEVISNNLANINSTGYKKDQSIFRTFYDDAINATASSNGTLTNKDFNSMVVIERTVSDFSEGLIKKTGNPLDLTITGDGFFELQGANGETYFTRAGNFQMNETGEIVNATGLNLMGDIAAITIEAGASSLESKGITFSEEGVLSVGDAELDRLSIFRFVDNSRLKKIGNNLYVNESAGNVSDEPFEGKIVQHHLEMSNVNPVQELTRMIVAQRAFEAYQRVMRTIMDDTTEKSISLVGRKG